MHASGRLQHLIYSAFCSIAASHLCDTSLCFDARRAGILLLSDSAAAIPFPVHDLFPTMSVPSSCFSNSRWTTAIAFYMVRLHDQPHIVSHGCDSWNK